MNKELYELIRPVRGIDQVAQVHEGHWFIRFADIHPRSFSSMAVGGWVSLMIIVGFFCNYIYAS